MLNNKKKRYLNSLCLLSVLLMAGSAPAIAEEISVSNAADLTKLLKGEEVAGKTQKTPDGHTDHHELIGEKDRVIDDGKNG